jgi:hypothetical protein
VSHIQSVASIPRLGSGGAKDQYPELVAGTLRVLFRLEFNSHFVLAQMALMVMILPENWTSGLDGALQVKLIH